MASGSIESSDLWPNPGLWGVWGITWSNNSRVDQLAELIAR